jgi:predicted RNA methylase
MPTSQKQLHALHGLAYGLGYSEEMIRQEFPVWVGEEVKLADLVAFGRPQPEPQDQTTSAILGAISESETRQAITMAAALAAPVAAIASANSVDIWAVDAGGNHEKLHELRYEDIGNPPSALVRELGPRSLTAAKEGVYQPALFPADVGCLLQEARKSSASRLISLVENTASDLGSKDALRTLQAKHDEVSRVSRLLIGAMAALMVSDKVLVDRAQSAERILIRAEERFPNYFQWTSELAAHEKDDLLDTINRLGQDVSYAGLDPSVVAAVYETAILDTAKRADFGVFYTPPELARKILSQIPIEELAPSDRHVLDPACGSGTFLLAAYDRLRDIAPLGLDLIEAHRDSAKRLTGFDIDPLAVEVARLALLLNAMPASNGWSVSEADALVNEDATKATVVVSNPPWRDIRSERGRRVQLADRFLIRMIGMLEPQGFLATVVPAGWLVSRTSRATRKALASQCSLFEVWRLPQDTFPGADIDVAVLLARKDRAEGGYVFRRVRKTPGWKGRFLDGEDPGDEVLLRTPNSSLRADTWTNGPLDGFKKKLAVNRRLGDDSTIRKGPVPTPPVKDRGGSGEFLWLPTLRGTKAYMQPSEDQLKRVHYPAEFNWRGDDGSLFRQPKVLISGVRNPDIPWRLKVIPDVNRGVIPRDSTIMVVPNDPEDVWALTALLGSSLVSCFIDTSNPGRSITIKPLSEIPLPSAANWRSTLRNLGRQIVQEAEGGRLTSRRLVEVDKTVIDCYELPARTYRDLGRYFEGSPAPEGGIRYPWQHRQKPAKEETMGHSSYGTVLDVGSEKLRLWIAGATDDDGEWVALPAGFPGSQLQAGATFEVVIPDDRIADGRFRFQSESFLELEDVVLDRG